MRFARTLEGDLRTVLDDWRKMAFVAGPRQVGKTTLARSLLAARPGHYFNWDLATDRRRLAHDPYFFEALPRAAGVEPLLVFDELHKYGRWKSYLKGVFDGFGERYRILVAGSGRLDVHRRGGDSLLGRYFALVLLPLGVAELVGSRARFGEARARAFAPPAGGKPAREAFEALLRFGGFPEPLARASADFHRAWSDGRLERLVREDIRDATRLRDLSALEILASLLPSRVGSPLSINALREDLEVAFDTARSWLETLEAFYYCFRLSPFTHRVARALRKEGKAYLYDWAEIEAEGPRFENLVAVHLLKAVRTWRAVGEGRLELGYVRDKEKREVDFVVTDARRPCLLVECKLADTTLAPALLRFQEALDVPVAVQLVAVPGVARRTALGGRTQWVVSADRWLGGLA